MLLKDKVVIMTGVGPGMGQKLAEIAAEEGAKVAISARSPELIGEIADRIVSQGGQAIAVPTDVGDMAACERLAAATLDAFGRIDGLINSAYRFSGSEPIVDSVLDSWMANVDITCFGALRMVKAVLPAMMRQREGSIVNVNTRSVPDPHPGQGGYVTAKSALAGATRQLAVELGQYNIRVNSPRMGWLWGAPVQHYVRSAAAARSVSEQVVIDEIKALIPLGVIPPDEECAKSVLFFVSDYSRMVTGTSMDVNGGQYMAA